MAELQMMLYTGFKREHLVARSPFLGPASHLDVSPESNPQSTIAPGEDALLRPRQELFQILRRNIGQHILL